MNILISAYAVSPNHGSEPGMGWNWIVNLATYCNLYVITEAQFKSEIEVAVQKLPQKNNLNFYFNDIGEKSRKLCWNQGDYRFYYYYRKWQKSTLTIANKIISEHKIDIIHQLNMIGYREPGYLWKIEGIPFIWGPVGGFTIVPIAYLPSLGIKNALFYTIKNVLNYIQAKTSIRVRKAANKADLIFAASGNTKSAFKHLLYKNSIVMSETGCAVNHCADYVPANVNSKEFNVLWVGRIIPTKQLGIALATINKVKKLDGLVFHIVGTSLNPKELDKYKKIATLLGIQDKCRWHGEIPRDKVDEIMRKSQLFFFTSIVEATSTVVMEAISNFLPILCFDTCGHGEIVSNKIGIKVPLENPKKSIDSFAAEIEYLHTNRQLLNYMSNNCRSVSYELSWNLKARNMRDYYLKLSNPNHIH